MDSVSFHVATGAAAFVGVILVAGWAWLEWRGNEHAARSKNHKNVKQKAQFSLEAIFMHLSVPESHRIQHAKRVMQHASRACRASRACMSADEILAVELAALLHDADDRKYFAHRDFENARSIMRVVYPDLEPLVIQMIGYVSSSKNGDTIPDECRDREWMLYPRWADRLEAIGWTGVVRAWEYTRETGRPLFTDETPKAKNVAELMKIASEERYRAYAGKSTSMIDHYYDKLLRLNNFKTENPYLWITAQSLLPPLIEVCLAFGENKLDNSMLVKARIEAENERFKWSLYNPEQM